MRRGGREIEYTCVDVPRYVYEGFKAAKSRGRFFSLNIKGKYLDRIFK